MAQIVDAAAEVFLERGYEGASTNLIAARAGVSPGSLYQFFRNKEAIAEALARRYGAVFGEALDAAFLLEAAQAEPHILTDRVVDTLIAVNVAHPALRTVFRGWDAPPPLADAIRPLSEGILARVTGLISARHPAMAAEEVRRVAETTIALFRGLAPLALGADPRARAAMVGELKTALAAYVAATDSRVSPRSA